MNQTPVKLIFTIVISVAFLSFICVSTLCLSLFLHVYAGEGVLTAIIGTTGLLIGALVTMLSNTRTQPPNQASTTTTTTAPTQPVDQSGDLIVTKQPEVAIASESVKPKTES